MFRLVFNNNEPVLIFKNVYYHGINILQKLDKMLKEIEHDDNAYEYIGKNIILKTYFQVCRLYTSNIVPSLGYKLHSKLAVAPYKTIDNIGYDITIVSIYKKITGMIIMYETDVSLSIPLGYYVDLIARSSLIKNGYMLGNSVGVIDPGYTGTIKVPLVKIDPTTPDLELPSRVAQLILRPYVVSELHNINNHVLTVRGSNGFGSTD
jgi:deoxyuridine 5'-triphosphate nucleotidohydrolase